MDAPLRTPQADPALVDRLRDDLAAWTVDTVAELLGPVASAALHREDPLPARRALTTQPEEPLGTVLRAFVLGDVVTADALDRALPSLGSAGAAELGLVERSGGEVRSLVDLRPYGDEQHAWWVASDPSEMALGGPLPTEHVLGIGGASTTLASWTPRSPVRRALDLGTGCGVQALHLSSHADRVVATDLSVRALAYARFNAALAGLAWDLREGSLLDPVAGETFDLVVSNPPFVITPRAAGVPTYEYRDGGATGDQVVERLVTGVGAHLTEGGVAQLLGNWEVHGDGDWRDRVGAWAEASGLDAWVVQREVQDPAEYAALWSRDGGHVPGTAEQARLVTAWLDDFAARGVEAIGFGVITLARPRGGRAPFVELTEASGPVATPMGPAVASGLAARTWLADHDDDAVLDTAWVVPADVTEERHGRPGDADPSVILLRQGGGLGRAVRLDTLGAALLSVCDGELTARQSLTAIAALLDVPTGEALGEGVRLVRGLVGDGLLRRL